MLTDKPQGLRGNNIPHTLIPAVLIIAGLTSCNQKAPTSPDLNLKYIRIMRSGAMDTIYRSIEHWNNQDSLVTIRYCEKIYGHDVHKMTYQLSVQHGIDSTIQARLLQTKSFEFEGKDYVIMKYLYDNPDGDDEEMFYFYSPEFGILVFKNAWWGNYDRLLITPDEERNRIIFYLVEMIANNDKEFFVNWR